MGIFLGCVGPINSPYPSSVDPFHHGNMVFPIFHELVTAVMSAGDVLTGNPAAASERWAAYAQESIIGSGCAALHHQIHGEPEKATEYAKGLGRATGQCIAGGGLLQDVPVFHELATCGKSLGDAITGDLDTASKRWTEDYVQSSVAGSGVMAIHEARMGNSEKAVEYLKGCGMATGRAAITGATVAVTGGVAFATAPLGSVTRTITTAAAGGLTSAGGVAANAALNNDPIQAGDVVGGGLLGAGAGAIGSNKLAKLNKIERVYRVMPCEEGEFAVRNQNFHHGYKQGGLKGETCFSESSSHSRTYMPVKQQQHPNLDYHCYQAKVDKAFMKEVKGNAIQQQGSRAVNDARIKQNQTPHNIRNQERIGGHTAGKGNLLIKGPENLSQFNDHVVKIKPIDPNSLKNRVPTVKHVARLGKQGAAAMIVGDLADNHPQ